MAEDAGCESPGQQPPGSFPRPAGAEDGPNTPLSHNKGSMYAGGTAEGVEVVEDGRRNDAAYTAQLSAVSDLSLEVPAFGGGGDDDDGTPRSHNTVEVDRVPAGRGGGGACPAPPVAAAAASLKPKGVRRIRNPARSPRPRRMRAVDWCPDMDTSGGHGSSQHRGDGRGVSASNATTATSRAVRPGDDPTVNSYATFTTMGEGSILEVDTEDEEGSSSSSSGGSSRSGTSVGTDDVAGGAGGSRDGLGDYAPGPDGVVDRLPPYSRKDNASIGGTTAHALRPDDQSVVTFATSEDVRTFGYGDGGGGGGGIVDKVPQPSTPTSPGGMASVATNRAVQMADEGDSLATWNTTNTVGLTGNVVDHVPEERISHHHRPAQGLEEEEEGEDELDDIDDDMTVETSNAIKDEPSVSTFATQSAQERGISNVVDAIPTFAGGGVAGRSVASAHAIRAAAAAGDDRSVGNDTMTTLGDLGSIYEEPLDSSGYAYGRQRFLSGDNQLDRRHLVVDVIPEQTGCGSVMSGTTNHSVRTADEESRGTFATMSTAGAGANQRRFGDQEKGEDLVDQLPLDGPKSVVSGATNLAVRLNDDQSVATWATSATSAIVGHVNEHVVDKTPPDDTIRDGDVSDEATGRAIKDPEDASVTTWNTLSLAGNLGVPVRASDDEHMVDQVPVSGSDTVRSGTTDAAVRLNDDQSVATWLTTKSSAVATHVDEHVVDATPEDDVDYAALKSADVASRATGRAVRDPDDQSTTTWNTLSSSAVAQDNQPDRAGIPFPEAYPVDRVPSYPNSVNQEWQSGSTVQAVRAFDDQSVVTFATVTEVNNPGHGNSDNLVDKVPTNFSTRPGLLLNGTDSAAVSDESVQMGDNASLATWATTNTMGNQLTGKVVDLVPSNEKGGGDDSKSFSTNRAIKDETSVATFTTSGMSHASKVAEVIDCIPTFAGGNSVASGATSRAVRIVDDCKADDNRSTISLNTMTTYGDVNSTCEEENSSVVDLRNGDVVDRTPSSSGDKVEATASISGRTDSAVKGDDLTINTIATNASLPAIARQPTAGILRESRIRRQSAPSPSPNSGYQSYDMNGPENVSNTHLLRAITDLRFHVDYRIGELREFNRLDSERILQAVQQEQQKRTALEARLHSQLLLQSESMVAMELKLLRLEAKINQRDSRRRQRSLERRQPGMGANAPIDRLPPIAATSSTPNGSDDEEIDSFEEQENIPRANRQAPGSTSLSQSGMLRGGGPIAVVTRSGASVASAVTATSFQDQEDFAHAHDDRSDGIDEDDGSASTPTQGSRNPVTAQRVVSNIPSILLNPLHSGSNDPQSTRAVRGESDGLSTLQTNASTRTAATMDSTVITSTTRGESVGITRINSRAFDEGLLTEEAERESVARSTLRSSSIDLSADGIGNEDEEISQATETLGTTSVASASLDPGPSILSTAAVAPSRSFASRRANAAYSNANAGPANRVVSFTTHVTASQLPHGQEIDGGADSITMPDELDVDNLSDVAEQVAQSSRVWRNEYEARLRALERNFNNN